MNNDYNTYVHEIERDFFKLQEEEKEEYVKEKYIERDLFNDFDN